MFSKAVRIIIVTTLSLVVSGLGVIVIYAEGKILGTIFMFQVWSWPGAQLAHLIERLVPNKLLYGSPDSRFYWPDATFFGLWLWLSIAFWWVVSFVVISWVTARRMRKQ